MQNNISIFNNNMEKLENIFKNIDKILNLIMKALDISIDDEPSIKPKINKKEVTDEIKNENLKLTSNIKKEITHKKNIIENIPELITNEIKPKNKN